MPHKNISVLLVDDEVYTLRGFEMQLLGEGFTDIVLAENGGIALEKLAERPFDIMLLDLRMPEVSGEQVLSEAVEKYPGTKVIMVTAVDEVESAVACMKAGAYEYLVKPVNTSRLLVTIKKTAEFLELDRENRRLQESVLDEDLRQPEVFQDIITTSAGMLRIFRYIESIAPSPEPVLITGETGTGKELIAEAIHKASGRKGGLVTINAAEPDETLFSDLLFGHKKGAFTGADTNRQGLVEKAAGGTLFLDEIGDLSLSLQAKLLRLLQEGEYYPLGSDTPKRTDARLITATNLDLERSVDEKRFRADLFYRLRHHLIQLPPLRERREDLRALIDHFIAEATRELKVHYPTAPPELYTLLKVYDFPGNIRELRALLFNAVSIARGNNISLDSMRGLLKPDQLTTAETLRNARQSLEEMVQSLEKLPSADELQQAAIEEALRRTEGNQSLAADMLGITRQTVARRIARKHADE